MGITGQWSGTVPVDEQGRAIGNAVIWLDLRGSPYIRKLMAGLVNVGGFAVDKLIRWLQIVGAPPGNAGTEPIGHILYLKDQQPGIYGRTYKFLEPIDYIGMRLTGCIAASFELDHAALAHRQPRYSAHPL